MSLEKFPDLFLNISETDVKPETIHSYRFKSFTLNPLERQLFDRDKPVSLAPKAFDILTLLIVNAGHLVTKEELMESIWANAFVEEANLARLIHTVRKALGEDENGNKFIETVPTKGYRFVAEVETVVTRENAGFTTSDSDEWPDRLEPRESNRLMSRRFQTSRWLFAMLAIVMTFGLVAGFGMWWRNTPAADSNQRLKSIAVLPFRPIGPGEHDHSYSVAFANAVIGDLDQSKKIQVRPFRQTDYTELTDDAIKVGKERGTDYVLESNYVANGGRLVVTSYLINVATESVDATIPYDHPDADLFAAARKVSAEIVPKLLTKLHVPIVEPSNRGTENQEAWQSYLQGMILSNKRTVEDAEKALDEFHNAIRLDPNFAQAYMGLAHAIQTKLTNGGEREKLCGPAREAELKALELDPTMGDALVFLATNRMLCTFEVAQAEQEYQRAIDMSPNSAHVRRFYAVNIVNEKRFDEALHHLSVARELDPDNPFNLKLIGRAQFFARRWDEAIETSKKAKDLVPEAEQTSFVYMSYEMKGDLEKAFEWFLIVKELEHETEEKLNAWRATYAKGGWPAVLKRRLALDLQAEKTETDINKRARLLEEITTLSVQLGKDDQAFDYMNKAVDSYVLFSGQLPVNPYLDRVRSDPRYKAIMERTWYSHGRDWETFPGSPTE